MKRKRSPLPMQPMPEDITLSSSHRASKEAEIKPESRDLESDESVSTLYHRWRLHHNITRAPDETDDRLDIFKENAIHLFEMNQKDPSCQFHLSSVCDERDMFEADSSYGDERTRLTATEEDLESDEAVWDLYYRWCVYHTIFRTPEQMRQRFDNFKTSMSYAVKMSQKKDPSSNSYRDFCSNYLSIWCDIIEIRYSSGVDEMTLAPTNEDMESDEALWDLYRRWRDHHKIHRTPEEMKLAFKSFKKVATHAFEMSQRDSSVAFCLSSWCDETVMCFTEVSLIPTERDLKSGNALLNFYHRFDRSYYRHTDPEEMRKRFYNFKKIVDHVFEKNKLDPSGPVSLGRNCDKKDVRLDEATRTLCIMPTFRDLASDETVLALYRRWCIQEETPRTPEEMRQRFDIFKECALEVFEMNVERPGSQAMLGECDE